MKQIFKRKIIIVILCICLVTITFLSLMIAATYSNHHCDDIHCAVCAQLQNAQNHLNQVGSSVASALVLACVWFLQLTSIKILSLNCSTLITHKVRMND